MSSENPPNERTTGLPNFSRPIPLAILARSRTEAELFRLVLAHNDDLELTFVDCITPDPACSVGAETRVVLHVCDLSYPGPEPGTLMRSLRLAFPNAALAIMTSCESTHMIRAVLAAGASAYMHFGRTPLAEAVDILRGLNEARQPVICRYSQSVLARNVEPCVARLTRLQLEMILALPELVRGEANWKTIAERLGMPYSAFRKGMHRLRTILSASTEAELYRIAVEKDILGYAKSRLHADQDARHGRANAGTVKETLNALRPREPAFGKGIGKVWLAA